MASIKKSMNTESGGRRNGEVARYLKRIHSYLLIAGYDERHAAPYGRLAMVIESHPEDIETLAKERRLKRISRLGWKIEKTIRDYLATGSSERFELISRVAPPSVLELLDIPGIGVNTTRSFFLNFGISSREELKLALDDGWLQALGIYRASVLSDVHQYLRQAEAR